MPLFLTALLEMKQTKISLNFYCLFYDLVMFFTDQDTANLLHFLFL